MVEHKQITVFGPASSGVIEVDEGLKAKNNDSVPDVVR